MSQNLLFTHFRTLFGDIDTNPIQNQFKGGGNCPLKSWCNQQCNYNTDEFLQNKMGKCKPRSLNGLVLEAFVHACNDFLSIGTL